MDWWKIVIMAILMPFIFWGLGYAYSKFTYWLSHKATNLMPNFLAKIMGKSLWTTPYDELRKQDDLTAKYKKL